MDLRTEIDRAAQVLPPGWQVVIEVEQGSASVSLVDPNGTSVDIHFDEDLAGAVADAWKIAVGL